MLRRILCAGFIATVVVSLAAAEEFGAAIVKIENGKMTFAKTKRGADKKTEKGPEETLPIADKVKVSVGTFNFKDKKYEQKEELASGLQNERFKNIGEKGVRAQLVTEDGKVTEVRVIEFRKKNQ